jgi:hypothetical protein
MEITGFDEQIGVVRKSVKAIKRAVAPVKRAVAPVRVVAPVKRGGVFNKLKPSQIRVAPTRVVTTTRAVAPVKRGGVFNKLKPSQIRVAPTRVVTTTRAVVPSRSVFVKPTQPSRIVTAKQFRKLKSAPVTRPTMVTRPSAPVTRPMMVTRPSAPIKVFSTDGNMRNVTPATFKQMSDVQRSFARVDLPYQAVTPPTRVMRIKNSPVNLPININMIEPAVDAGVQDYYGK